MQYFKKFPLFFTITLALVLVFIAGVIYNFMLVSDVAKSEKALRNARSDFEASLSEDPSQRAIDCAVANIKTLEAHLALLEKDLTRARNDIFSAPPAEPYQLVEQLRGMVQKWKRSARNKNISLAKGMDFGFKKYVAPNAEPPEEKAVAPIWKQACVLNYINGKLFDCKTEESPMAIVNVQREILADEDAKAAVQTTRRLTARERRAQARMAALSSGGAAGETFTIDSNITARKKGSLDTLAYRFTFAGHTDILRRFLNKLKVFDAMLVVRSIDVKPADDNVKTILNRKAEEEDVEGLSDLFGNSDNNSENSENAEGATGETTASESKTPVVSDNLSEFTVVIEYVEVVKEPEVKKVVKKEEE